MLITRLDKKRPPRRSPRRAIAFWQLRASTTSIAITWKTRAVRRDNDLHFVNSSLRGSMAMRKLLRRIGLGKKANIYLKEA